MINGKCGENLSWQLDDGTLTIGGNGKMNNDQDFSKYSIERVIVADGVTSVADFAFNFCNYLKEIRLPESLTEIGTGAFLFCENLRAIKIPAGVTEIAKSTFCGCWSLSEIELPEKLAVIGESAFANCLSLRAIEIPGVVEIDCKAFASCESLEKVRLPDGVVKIGSKAFAGCESLRDIKIPATVTELGDDIFSDCSALEKIYYAAGKGFEKILSAGNDAELVPMIDATTSNDGLNWTLDGDTLTIRDAGKLKSLSHDENFPWHDRRESIKKIVITS